MSLSFVKSASASKRPIFSFRQGARAGLIIALTSWLRGCLTMMMTNEDLFESAKVMIGGDVAELSYDQLLRLITTA